MDTIGTRKPRKSMFDLSETRKVSFDMGQLIPCYLKEVIPGDTFKIEADILLRFMPLVSPTMEKIVARIHFFFVPNRLVWSNWENFITGGEDGDDATVHPYFDYGPISKAHLLDYLGLPLGVDMNGISALPTRAYNLIKNEWYRNQNTEDKVIVAKTDGYDGTTPSAVQTACWGRDYFTTATPSPQRGTAVTIPLGTSAPVSVTQTGRLLSVGETVGSGSSMNPARHNAGNTTVDMASPASLTSGLRADETERTLTGSADLSTASAATVNQLRTAFQLQRWAELNARGGVRYAEMIYMHFNTISPDARLQRPEYLGGMKTNIIISEIPQTSKTDTNAPQGNLAGHGYGVMSDRVVNKSFTEHGLIVGILSVLPQTSYMQGIPRMYSRPTRFDYYWPDFAHIGAQAILKKEIYAQGTVADNEVWGYADRYDEYRQGFSSVHGDFRDNLDHWHMVRKFDSMPSLNSTFTLADPTNRIFAVTSGEQHLLAQIHFKISAIRPIPLVGDPGYLDH